MFKGINTGRDKRCYSKLRQFVGRRPKVNDGLQLKGKKTHVANRAPSMRLCRSKGKQMDIYVTEKDFGENTQNVECNEQSEDLNKNYLILSAVTAD